MELEVDGKTAHAGTGGAAFDPALPCVAFIHGGGMDHTVWALQARYFAHHGRAVLAVDLPGHGHSEGPPLEDIPAMADWLARLLDAAGVAKAKVVGHSMGAITAIEMAARHPERTEALALLGATSAMPVNAALLDATRDDPALAIQFIVSWAYGAKAHLGGMRAPGLWMLAGGQRLLERGAAGMLFADFNACNAYQGGDQATAKVSCPTLILCGDRDRMTPARDGRALAGSIKESRLETIADGGHMMMIEEPDQTLDALKSFL